MSREKQIEECYDLEEIIYMSGYGLHRGDCYAIANQIQEQGYRKQEWISVEDRLPNREGKYLVCTTNGNIGVGNFIDYYGKGTHLCFDCWAVTHWMPLPEAPKMKGGAE